MCEEGIRLLCVDEGSVVAPMEDDTKCRCAWSNVA